MVGARTAVVVALDWPSFARDGHETIRAIDADMVGRRRCWEDGGGIASATIEDAWVQVVGGGEGDGAYPGVYGRSLFEHLALGFEFVYGETSTSPMRRERRERHRSG